MRLVGTVTKQKGFVTGWTAFCTPDRVALLAREVDSVAIDPVVVDFVLAVDRAVWPTMLTEFSSVQRGNNPRAVGFFFFRQE